MYPAPHRPSILHRPLKGQSQATTETFDSQHEREQQYWAAKAQRSAQTQERVLKNLYPTPLDKLEAADEARLALDIYARAKEQQRLHDQAQEDVWTRPATARSEAMQPEGRPWEATTFTAYGSKEEEDVQRRRVACQISDDNRMAIQQNALRKLHQEEAERKTAHMTVTDESSFWNLGSTNDRWLPPERRRSPRGDGHLSAPGPVHLRAPYAADGQHSAAQLQALHNHASAAGSAAGSPRPMAYGMPRPASALPAPPPIWAWAEPEQLQAPPPQQAAAMPWATEAMEGGGGAAADPRQLQRFNSRPAPTRCPFATDRDLPPPQHQDQLQYQYQAPYGSQAPEQEAAHAAAWAAAPPLPLRYSSRPTPQPRPYGYDAEDVHARPPSAPYVASRPATAQDQGLAAYGAPAAYGSRPATAQDQGMAAYGAAAAARPGVSQRFVSRPGPQPCPFAVDPPAAAARAWAPQDLPDSRNFPWL